MSVCSVGGDFPSFFDERAVGFVRDTAVSLRGLGVGWHLPVGRLDLVDRNP